MHDRVRSTPLTALFSGAQGLGIALVAAVKAQVPVTLVDSAQNSLDKGIGFAGWLPPLRAR